MGNKTVRKMNEDPKRKIRETLSEMAMETGIEKINVSMLVKKCGISRTLFYYYYEDIFAVLDDILMTEFGKLVTACMKIDNHQESIRYFVSNYVEHFLILRKILRTKYYEQAERMIAQVIRKYLRIMLTHKAGDLPMKYDDAEFIIDFVSNGMTVYFFQHCEDTKFDVDYASEHFYQMIMNLF